LIILLQVFFQSCKKGENDPFISLLSRKARVSGDWKLKEGNLKIGIKDTAGVYSEVEYVFTEDTYTYTELANGKTSTSKHDLTLNFTRKGEFTMSQTMNQAVCDVSGTWDFDKGKGKNKENLYISIDHLEKGNSGFIDFFNKSFSTFTYRIKELRNKKIVLVSDKGLLYSEYGGVICNLEAEYTFVQ
jgi:hypothetical protein